MLNHKKIISVSELKEGMIAAKDIYDRKDMLLAKDNIITESVIDKINDSYVVDRVEVYIDNALHERKVNKSLSFNLKTIHEVDNLLNNFSSEIERMFESISNLKKTDIDELRAFTKNIQFQFTSTGAILKNIAFNTSREENLYRHSVNVAALSLIIGKWVGINGTELNFLIYSAALHDYGKTKLDNRIIEKNEKLTLKEYNKLKTHPILGYEFMKKFAYLDSCVSYGILMHHERMDGSGYPLGLKGDRIHKFSKIIAIADVFDEISSGKYAENIRGPFEVLDIIRQESFKRLDFKYCNMFINHIINFYIGEEAILNDNRLCKVVYINKDNLLNPILLHDGKLIDLSKEKDVYVERFVI